MTAAASQLASLRADLRRRWQRGEAVRVEAYLQEHVWLENDSLALLDLITNEVVMRQERGEAPQLDEYRQRFRHLDDQLPLLFDASRTLVIASKQAPPDADAPPVPPPASSAPADAPSVPGYELIAELGRGGMGVVYQARQCSLKRLVALKVILAGSHADETTRTRFRTEAEAVARLQHPNIVQVYEVGEHNGCPFLCLEYIAGGTLDQKLAGTAQPEREAAALVETLARAIQHSHERGILHRDLKPANVLLTGDGTPKVMDFGLAKFLDADGPTRSEALIGTPNYMSPEQAAGQVRRIGVPSDVYSLGAILYALLTGQAPFQGHTLLGTLEQVRTQDPVPPRRLRQPVSRDLETICLRCLEKEPTRRYPTAAALADDLRRFLDDQPIHARPIPPWQRWARAVRRRPARAASLLAVIALTGALVAAGAQWQSRAELERHRSEERFQQFLERRNDALFYGLLAADEGARFLGTDAAANSNTAESAARAALALAGVDIDSDQATVTVPAARQAEVAADCYALLLVLANVRGQSPPGADGNARRLEALRLLDRARTLGFDTRGYHRRRAQLLAQLGRHDDARREAALAGTVPASGALDHYLLGEEQFRQNDWAAAMGSFNRALALQPDHFWAHFFLALCQLKAHEWQAARASLNACLTRQSGFVWAYLFRSFANEQLQALGEAEADFEQALRLNPTSDARYILLLTRGILCFNQGDLARAAADFRAARDLKPGQYNAYVNLAQIHLAQKQFDAAAEQARQAEALRPPVHVVLSYHLERARGLVHARRWQDAVQACDAALEIAPEHPLPYELRGHALLALQQYEQAEWSFELFVRKGGTATSDTFRARGQARMKLGRFPEAADDYTRALQLAPDAEIYQHRGWAHFFSDAWKLALRDFTRAIELNPADTDALVGRGLARVMLGDHRQAVADAYATFARKPRAPEMMHNIACIFALAADRVALDPAAPDREASGNEYRKRALVAVAEALRLVPADSRQAFWQEKVLIDPALASLRGDPRFLALGED
jgi:tetratricopeptide (TPR) repeat protein